MTNTSTPWMRPRPSEPQCRRARDGGFSLVEIIVTIVLLGLLAAVASLLLTGTASDANTATCKNDVATLNKAANIFFAKHARSADDLEELVTVGLLKDNEAIDGYTFTRDAYTIQYSPANPASSGPGTNTGIGVCGVTPALTGNLLVGAATSLTASFNQAGAALEAANTGFDVSFSFGGSNTIAANIHAAGPGLYDVFASADLLNMNNAIANGDVAAGSQRLFARNTPVIIVDTEYAGTPITEVPDLLGLPANSVTLGNCNVPIGTYSRQILASYSIAWSMSAGACADATAPGSPVGTLSAVGQTNVGLVLAGVGNGTFTAGIVYRTDAIGVNTDADPNNNVAIVDIPNDHNVIAEYYIAPVVGAPNPEAAHAFIQSAVSGQVQSVLQSRGFAAP